LFSFSSFASRYFLLSITALPIFLPIPAAALAHAAPALVVLLVVDFRMLPFIYYFN
jgi:hypothetical protein